MHIPKTEFEKIRHFPYEVEVIQHTWIRMSDGSRLSAKLWLPKTTEAVPAILEFIPYRKRDITCYRDSINHGYFAGHGYACVRVDIRGSGDSEGVLEDEYLQQELSDGVEVIHWIAKQNWCSGHVGMMGKSWGGFNALQVAALQPEPLKAIISISSAADRYSTDVHYMGGCLLGDNLSWAAEMFAFNACPPDPKAQGELWKENWLKRLEGSGVWLKKWLEHPYRDDYWKHGSVCEDYSKIQCPVYVISGWADGYSNTVFNLVENLEAPCIGLIGPWGHSSPHMGLPGPGMGFLQEAKNWWDHWLKGKDNGIMKGPKLKVWMQESTSPTFVLAKRPGHWVGVDKWPTNKVNEETYHFTPGRRLRTEASEKKGTHLIESPLSVGLFAGKWCSFSSTPDLPHDQREEDGGALVFQTSILKESVQILGAPRVKLKLKSDKKQAMIAVRLCDVHPDGKVTRVSYGLMNLSHRDSPENPEYLPENEYVTVDINLNNVAQVFEKGHRIRLSFSTSYWPIAWPAPEPTRLTLERESCRLYLPVVCQRLQSDISFAPPIGAEPLQVKRLQLQDYDWKVIRDLGKDISILSVLKDEGSYYLPSVDTQVSRKAEEVYRYHKDDYSSLSGVVRSERRFYRPDSLWDIRTNAETQLSSDKNNFYIRADMDAFQGAQRIFCNSWHYSVPRRFL